MWVAEFSGDVSLKEQFLKSSLPCQSSAKPQARQMTKARGVAVMGGKQETQTRERSDAAGSFILTNVFFLIICNKTIVHCAML